MVQPPRYYQVNQWKKINENIERERIIVGKVGIVDENRTNKEVKYKEKDRKAEIIRSLSWSIHIHLNWLSKLYFNLNLLRCKLCFSFIIVINYVVDVFVCYTVILCIILCVKVKIEFHILIFYATYCLNKIISDTVFID